DLICMAESVADLHGPHRKSLRLRGERVEERRFVAAFASAMHLTPGGKSAATGNMVLLQLQKCPAFAGHFSFPETPGLARSSFCNCWQHTQLPVAHVPYYGNNHHHCQHLHTLFIMNCFVSCFEHL